MELFFNFDYLSFFDSRIPFVSPLWIFDCLKFGKRVSYLSYPPLLKQGRCLGDDVIVFEMKETANDFHRKKKDEERKKVDLEKAKRGRKREKEKKMRNEKREEPMGESDQLNLAIPKKNNLGENFNHLDNIDWHNPKIEELKKKMLEKKMTRSESESIESKCSFHTQSSLSTSLLPSSASISSSTHIPPPLDDLSLIDTTNVEEKKERKEDMTDERVQANTDGEELSGEENVSINPIIAEFSELLHSTKHGMYLNFLCSLLCFHTILFINSPVPTPKKKSSIRLRNTSFRPDSVISASTSTLLHLWCLSKTNHRAAEEYELMKK